MATLSKCPRFVIVFDDGSSAGSETVYQSDLPDMIRRLIQHNCRINDVQPMTSEWDEDQQYQQYVAAMPPEHERPF